jgi:hypothetical protein
VAISNFVMSAKEEVIALIENLPADWSREEIEYFLYMRKRIERSVSDIRERHRETNYDLRHQVDMWKRRLLARN